MLSHVWNSLILQYFTQKYVLKIFGRGKEFKSPSWNRTHDLQIRSEWFNSLRSASRKKTMLDSIVSELCHNIVVLKNSHVYLALVNLIELIIEK